MIKRMDKLPKRKVTVAELLDKDDVQHILETVTADREKIDEIIVIWENDGEDSIHWLGNMSKSRTVYFLEKVKKCLLEDE